MKTALVVVSLLMVNCSLLLGMENRDRHIVNRDEQFKENWIDYIKISCLDKGYKGHVLDCIKNNTDASGKLLWQNARRDIESLKRGVPIAQGPALWTTFVSTYSFLFTLYMNMSSANNHYGPVSEFEEQSQPCKFDIDALRTLAPALALLHAVGAAYEFKSSFEFDADRRVQSSYFSDDMRKYLLAFLACTALVDDSFLCSADPSFHGSIVGMQWLKLFTVCVPLYLMLSTSSPDCENSGCTQLFESCVRKGRLLRGDVGLRNFRLDLIIKYCDDIQKK